jgi:hypothetical protein
MIARLAKGDLEGVGRVHIYIHIMQAVISNIFKP